MTNVSRDPISMQTRENTSLTEKGKNVEEDRKGGWFTFKTKDILMR